MGSMELQQGGQQRRAAVGLVASTRLIAGLEGVGTACLTLA
jgi:hypothetical protein